MADSFELPSLTEMVKNIMQNVENKLYDRAAMKAGYDPTTAYILGALTTDHNEMTNPQNALGPAYGLNGLTVGQIQEMKSKEFLIKDLITHYGKRYGKPQRTGDGTDPPIQDTTTSTPMSAEQLRKMT